ncbi:hypothetical protein BESB_055780 [Besnoitia besnoiti]|uniref:Uncharacterized protein n=1 Tax=Besnoitia besnoiti TaxID=94643 RepID=A0A2A9MJZ8_BESBE|nr:hypothetical protein BESB_055780 [Besnoitia besnoiti]PFH35927.1 hypothetical protein BESB_055780 [Besnoitia besnoiti]
MAPTRRLFAVAAGLLAPISLADCSSFSEQSPDDRVEGVLNSLSLLRMKAAFLEPSQDDPHESLYSQFAQNGAVMIIDCRMGVQSADTCMLHGFSHETRVAPQHSAAGFYRNAGSTSTDSPAAVTISAYKNGERVFEDEYVKQRIGEDLAEQAGEIYALAERAGLLEAGAIGGDARKKRAIKDMAERSNKFWTELAQFFVKQRRSGEAGSNGSHEPHKKKSRRTHGGENHIAEQDISPKSGSTGASTATPPAATRPNLPSTAANLQSAIPKEVEAGGEFLANIGRAVASQVFATPEEIARQAGLSLPFSSLMGMVPSSFLQTGMNLFGAPQLLTAPMAIGSSLLLTGGGQSGFPFFPFNPGTLMTLMQDLESGGSRLPSAVPTPPPSSSDVKNPEFKDDDIDAAIDNFAMTEADLF